VNDGVVGEREWVGEGESEGEEICSPSTVIVTHPPTPSIPFHSMEVDRFRVIFSDDVKSDYIL
jgi:hypothetical protein